jgi:hypothetical protein
MKIKIKNDRNEVIALLQAKDSELTIFQVPSKRTSWISDVYTDQDGELCYTVETCFKEEIVEQLSNDDLLNELKKRMVVE